VEWWLTGLIVGVGLLTLLASGMPIGFAAGVLGVVGLIITGRTVALFSISTWAYGTLADFILIALPLFIFMAEVLAFTGLSDDLFDALDKWMGKLPGGLAVASVGACAAFAASSGSSTATAATMGVITIPEMLKRGYNKSFCTGAVAAGGTLGILIPPSIAMIIYGIWVEQSIGRLFVAGFIPGIITAAMMMTFIVIAAAVRPSLAPRGESTRVTWRERFIALFKVWPIVAVFLSIMGSIYFGIATPTEAAAIGVVVVLSFAAFRRKLTIRNLSEALLGAVRLSVFILVLIIGMTILAYLLTTLRIPQELSGWVVGLGLSKWGVIWAMIVTYFVMGMFLDVIGMLMLTLPIFYPIAMSLGFDPIWYGIMLVLNMEVALLTPPVGLNVYVLKGVVDPYGVRVEDIFKGVVPFVAILLISMVLLQIWPQIALWLPSTMH
jgi:tripartite ATP-independent transporter DctM subunit